MEQKTDSRSGSRGLTVKQLTFIFIAGVGVCAIFFTLGFLVGTNERSINAANALAVEHVSPPGDIPPPVNAPPGTTRSSGENAGTPNDADSAGQVQEQNIPPTGTQGGASAPVPSSSLAVPATTPHARVALKKQSASPSASPPASPRPGSGFIVQIAALHSAKDAESMVGTLRARGYPAFLVTPQQAGTNDGVYRVQVGPYPSRPAAGKVQEKLVKEGFNPFVK